MEYILIFLVGMLVGILGCSLTMNTEINDLLEEKYNAELRAVTHFRKLFNIEILLNKAEAEKEPAVFTVDKIKEVIEDRKINK